MLDFLKKIFRFFFNRKRFYVRFFFFIDRHLINNLVIVYDKYAERPFFWLLGSIRYRLAMVRWYLLYAKAYAKYYLPRIRRKVFLFWYLTFWPWRWHETYYYGNLRQFFTLPHLLMWFGFVLKVVVRDGLFFKVHQLKLYLKRWRKFYRWPIFKIFPTKWWFWMVVIFPGVTIPILAAWVPYGLKLPKLERKWISSLSRFSSSSIDLPFYSTFFGLEIFLHFFVILLICLVPYGIWTTKWPVRDIDEQSITNHLEFWGSFVEWRPKPFFSRYWQFEKRDRHLYWNRFGGGMWAVAKIFCVLLGVSFILLALTGAATYGGQRKIERLYWSAADLYWLFLFLHVNVGVSLIPQAGDDRYTGPNWDKYDDIGMTFVRSVTEWYADDWGGTEWRVDFEAMMQMTVEVSHGFWPEQFGFRGVSGDTPLLVEFHGGIPRITEIDPVATDLEYFETDYFWWAQKKGYKPRQLPKYYFIRRWKRFHFNQSPFDVYRVPFMVQVKSDYDMYERNWFEKVLSVRDRFRYKVPFEISMDEPMTPVYWDWKNMYHPRYESLKNSFVSNEESERLRNWRYGRRVQFELSRYRFVPFWLYHVNHPYRKYVRVVYGGACGLPRGRSFGGDWLSSNKNKNKNTNG